jgi:hypothetical protein
MTWRKARKKPIIIEFREVHQHKCGNVNNNGETKIGEFVKTHEGTLFADYTKDFIIKGVDGELYPIKKAIFEKTYDVIP